MEQGKPNLNRITSLRMAPAPPPRDGRLSIKPPVSNQQNSTNSNSTNIDVSQFRNYSTTFQRRMDSPRVEVAKEPVPALERSISATGLPKLPPPRPPRASQTLSTESVLEVPGDSKKSSFPRIPFLSKKSKVNVDPNQFVPVNSVKIHIYLYNFFILIK